jgi:membrane fusion protein (multidrug efflux system)
VQASPKETELTYVKPGQTATIEVDSYPGSQWSGTVDSVSPASASSFSLLPAENTSGNWVKVVQRIPMRVRVDSQPGKPPLRLADVPQQALWRPIFGQQVPGQRGQDKWLV